MRLGEWLKNERERQGMTQAVAAAKANTTLRTWCRWETEERDWSPAQWRQAARALGKSTREADVVFAGLVLTLPAIPDKRWSFTATLLGNNKVLVVGGVVINSPFTLAKTALMLHL